MSSFSEHFHYRVLGVLVDGVVPNALPQVLLNHLLWFDSSGGIACRAQAKFTKVAWYAPQTKTPRHQYCVLLRSDEVPPGKYCSRHALGRLTRNQYYANNERPSNTAKSKIMFAAVQQGLRAAGTGGELNTPESKREAQRSARRQHIGLQHSHQYGQDRGSKTPRYNQNSALQRKSRTAALPVLAVESPRRA